MLTVAVLFLCLIAVGGCRTVANSGWAGPGAHDSGHAHDPAFWDTACHAYFWIGNLFTFGIGYIVDIATGNAPGLGGR